MKKLIIIVVGLLLILGVVSYLQRGAGEKAKVRIGVMTPLSGDFAKFGEDVRAGILDANIPNAEFIFEDEECDSGPALRAFNKLSQLDGIQYLIGPSCGGPQEVVAPLLRDKNIISLVPFAAAEKLYSESGGKMYQMQYSLEGESKFLAEKIFELGNRNIVLISYKNPFSETHASAFRGSFKGTIIKELSLTEDPRALPSALTSIKTLKPDAIFVADSLFFIGNGMTKLRELGITAPVFSEYSIDMPFFRPLAEGAVYSFPGGMGSARGVIYALAHDSAKFLNHVVAKCGGDVDCAKKELETSGKFNNGINSRPFVLRRVVNGESVPY